MSDRIRRRLAAIDWQRIDHELQLQGHAVIPKLLSAREARSLAGLYADDELFRSRVVMARHGFGRGEYKYFTYPLPDLVTALRQVLYPPMALVANRWHEMMKNDVRFPSDLREFLRRCHEAGQTRPTPLLLKYGSGDFNCLHQDLYGEQVFPLQVAILLSDPDGEFTGGEFILSEQRPRMQSRATVVPLRRGDGVIFAVNHRPVQGAKGVYRVRMRHGVSVVRSGRRLTAGVIFHDAN
ncbi:MAG: 2OG-Fe(II) oxygenase [Dongiaceae bacterium]